MRHWFPASILMVVAAMVTLLMLQMSNAASAGLGGGIVAGDLAQSWSCDATPRQVAPAPRVSGNRKSSTAKRDALTGTTAAIDMCTQHAPKCPLNEETWVGEPGAWQKTGKKWQWLSTTPSGKNVVWEWSMPYAGSNPAYDGQREDHYADHTDAPDTSPVFTTTDPYTYDWERWEPVEANYLFHQYGRASEAEAFHIGETDCESGVYYPILDHNVGYAYTPMSVLRDGQCVGGGYISAHRTELWGEPLSPARVSMCDNPATGVPAGESPKANAVCKLSPHVGVVYQRYAFNSTATLPAIPGCESVLYAWGWAEPQQVSGGQDYEAWFRNGELRFSRWLNLSDQVHGSLPAADDHEWWNSRCKRAWSDTTNVLYTGIYIIGSTVYTDTIALPVQVAAEIPTSGGSLTSTIDSIIYTFPSNTFADTATVTHTIRFQSDQTTTGDLVGVNRFFETAGVYSDTGRPALPTGPYTVTIQYTDAGARAVIESTLALYSWNGGQWAKEPTSIVHPDANTVVATPSHFSPWAVLGETRRVFLPSILKHAP